MKNGLEVACYEIAKYVVLYRKRNAAMAGQKKFNAEEDALSFLEENQDSISWFRMSKISVAIVKEKQENETAKDKFFRELVKIGGELYANEVMNDYTDREIEEEGEEILKQCWEDYRDYERDKADGRE